MSSSSSATSGGGDKPLRVISFDMGTRSMGFAHVEYPDKVLRMGIIDCGKNQARVASQNIIKLLHGEHRWMRDCGDPIVVEQQPSNGAVKTVSHAMQAYFYTVDLEDERVQRRARSVVQGREFCFMAAHNKLQYDLEVLERLRPKTHGDRKLVSMEVTERLLKGGPFEAYYNRQKEKQKTDLADAVIQALRWLQVKSGDAKLSGKKRSFFPTKEFAGEDRGFEITPNEYVAQPPAANEDGLRLTKARPSNVEFDL